MITTNSTLQDIKQDKIYGSVQRIVNKYLQYLKDVATYDDLMQEADIAIIKAIESYDYTKGVSLYNYILKRVRWAMGNYVRLKSHLVRHLDRKDIVDLDNEKASEIKDYKNQGDTIDNQIDTEKLISLAPAYYRELLYDIYIKDILETVIAEMKGVSVQCINKKKKRGIAHIRKKLKRLDKRVTL